MLELSKPHFQGPSLLSSVLESPPPIQVSPTVYLRSLLQCLKSKTKSQSANPSAFINSFLNYWAPLVAQMVKNLPAMQETQVQSLGGKIAWERE